MPTAASRGRREPLATRARLCARLRGHGRLPATAVSRIGTRSHGPGCCAAAEGPEEAAALAGVAGAPSLLLDDEQQDIHIAVVVRLAHVLAISRRLAFAPILLAAAGPEPGASRRERALERIAIHPADHQHQGGAGLLHDRRHETVRVVLHRVE